MKAGGSRKGWIAEPAVCVHWGATSMHRGATSVHRGAPSVHRGPPSVHVALSHIGLLKIFLARPLFYFVA